MPNTYTSSGTLATGAAAYATLAELRASPQLKLADGETADDSSLQALLDAVQAFIDTHTGYTFACNADTTRHLDAVRDVGGLTLYLKDSLAAITTITNGDSVVVSPSEYVTEPRDVLDPNHADYTPIWAIKLKASSGKSWTYEDDPEGAIAIAGKWAFSTSAPDDIRRATIIGAAALYRQSLSGDNDRPIIAGGGVVIQPSQLPATFWAIVNSPKYTRHV